MNQASHLTWDEKHAKALLGLRRYPVAWIQEEPWRSWLDERGGKKQVIERLLASALTPDQKQLLELTLAYPNASTLFYAKKLNMGHSSYFAQLNGLIKTVLTQLNDWKTAPQPQRAAHTPTNLPTPLTSLIGAEQSIQTVSEMLKSPSVRLLTLMGPGGVGKTRLAIAVGRELLDTFSDGVFFVPLETVSDPELLPAQVARALNVETVNQQSLSDTLKIYLRERQVLLVLDNFEQLVQASSFVADLLQGNERLKVLVTSREALSLYGEHRFIVPELPHPGMESESPLDELNTWPAIALFVQRVQAYHPNFALTESNREAVIGVCNRLDGLPLAIELAAAQVKFLSPEQTLPQLEHGLKSLRNDLRNRPLRQKTLWDAIDWSYQLLPDDEKALFRRLSVFGREWTVSAAQAVCAVDDALGGLEKLADKSLVRYAAVGVGGELRFQMLQAVREYALDQLAVYDEVQQLQRRHANHYLEMVVQAEPSIGTVNQLAWMRRIMQERENLQIALQWMLNQKETELAFQLLGAAWCYYNMLNIWDETKAWMDRALAQDPQAESAARVKTLWGAYWLTSRQNEHVKAFALVEEGLRVARKLGDQRLIGLMLNCMINELCYRQQYDEALQAVEESLNIFRALDDRDEIGWALGHRSSIFTQRGDLAKGREILQESLAVFRANGNDWALEQVLRDYALLLFQQNDLAEVEVVLAESLQLSEKLGKRLGIAWTLNLQGQLALRQSDREKARRLFEEAQVIFEKLGDQNSLADNREWLGRVSML